MTGAFHGEVIVDPGAPHDDGRRQRAFCPTCGDELAGLLAVCGKPDCWRASAHRDADLDHWRSL
jgi:hypothetical protein